MMSHDLSAVSAQRGDARAVGAHAFAGGSDIHLAPGQNGGAVPHEAWHTVQQGAAKPADVKPADLKAAVGHYAD